jgi:HEPN domain-containing protein
MQAVEKYLKALLVQRQIEFPKTHDIAKLLDRVATVDLQPPSR